MSDGWGSSSLLGERTINSTLTWATSVWVLPAPSFSSSSRPALPGFRHPACGFVNRLLAAEQVPRTSWSRLVGEVLLEGQSSGPGLEGENPAEGDLQGSQEPASGGTQRGWSWRGGFLVLRQKGVWGGERMCARQDEGPVRQFLEETGRTQPPVRHACYRDPEVPTGQGSARLHPKSRGKSAGGPGSPPA